jgi:hypothetical protein
LPEGRFGLAKSAYDWTQLVKLVTATKKANATALANSFSSVSKKLDNSITVLASGQVPEISNGAQAIAAIIASNNEALPNNKAAWMPWFQALDQRLKVLKPTELADLRDAFSEIATGLAAVPG